MGRNRKEIDNKFKWDLEKMYQSREEIEKDIEYIEKSYKEIEKYKSKMNESVDNFYNVIKLMEDSSRKLEYLYTYTHMKHHEDTRINENLADSTKSEMVESEYSKATAFIIPEILGMEEKTLNKYMEDERLIPYKRMIDEILRMKPHTLSEKEEELLAAVSELTDVPENTYEMLCFADMEFPEIKDEEGNKVRLDHFNYSTYIKSKDERVRKEAFEAEFSTYEKYKNTMASTLFAAIKGEIFNARTRKYHSALEASLFADDISVEVYNNLIKSVDENIGSLNRYLEIKKKYFDLEELHMYDLYVAMAKDFKMDIPFERAKEIILEALKPMGEDYVNLIKKAFEERWIDVYENEGKKGGAYSWGCYDSHPYILMGYTDDLNSMFTLIHELGHSMHSYLSHTNQPYIDSSYKIFVAEVASTVNEILLIKYLLKNAKSKEEKIYYLNYYLEQYRTTVYRQTLFAEFEKICHENVEAGNPMTAEDFNKVYFDLNKKYYGQVCIVDELSSVEWARIPHFYSNFYVYKYATGFSAASVLSDKILNEEGAVERYIAFLKSGGSDYPLELLRKAGVDMEKKEAVDGALKIFDRTVSELEELLQD
nr:oligoendopeptidase F [uncultured Peptostreptococcus sp.]